MNQSVCCTTSSYTLSIPCRMVAILFAWAFYTSSANGQEDPSLEMVQSLRMLDSSVPDFVSISKLEGVLSDREKSLGPLLRVKKASLESRLKQAKGRFNAVDNRVEYANAEVQKLRYQLQKTDVDSQSNSSIYLISRGSAEQLLIAAQLELQRVSWELASEQELLESTAKDEERAKKQENGIASELARIEFMNVQADMEVAEKELARVLELEKRGAIGASATENAKQAAAKAINAMRMQELRMKELEARQDASKDSQNAAIRLQIRRLTARKNQIEKYIKDLYASMGDLARREQFRNEIDRIESSIAANQQLRVDLEIKTEEIAGLLSLLNEVKLDEKKVKE